MNAADVCIDCLLPNGLRCQDRTVEILPGAARCTRCHAEALAHDLGTVCEFCGKEPGIGNNCCSRQWRAHQAKPVELRQCRECGAPCRFLLCDAHYAAVA